MSFENEVMGWFGDEKVVSSSKIGGLPYGTKMILPDGRVFRHAKAGAVELAAGKLVTSSLALAGHGNVAASGLICSAGAVGATSITVTLAGTVVTKDQYADGFINVSTGTGQGYLYKIKSHPAAASVLTCLLTLEPSDAIKVAFAAGTTAGGLLKNPWDGVLAWASATTLARPAGVPAAVVPASSCCWIQTHGLASVWQSATACVVGNPVSPDLALAGGVTAYIALTTASAQFPVGTCVGLAGSASYSTVFLTIE